MELPKNLASRYVKMETEASMVGDIKAAAILAQAGANIYKGGKPGPTPMPKLVDVEGGQAVKLIQKGEKLPHEDIEKALRAKYKKVKTKEFDAEALKAGQVSEKAKEAVADVKAMDGYFGEEADVEVVEKVMAKRGPRPRKPRLFQMLIHGGAFMAIGIMIGYFIAKKGIV